MSNPAFTAKNLAIITGGASGIGLAAAKAFASKFGMHVAIGDNSGAVEESVKAIQSQAKEGVKVWGGKVDVSDLQSVESFRNQIQT